MERENEEKKVNKTEQNYTTFKSVCQILMIISQVILSLTAMAGLLLLDSVGEAALHHLEKRQTALSATSSISKRANPNN